MVYFQVCWNFAFLHLEKHLKHMLLIYSIVCIISHGMVCFFSTTSITMTPNRNVCPSLLWTAKVDHRGSSSSWLNSRGETSADVWTSCVYIKVNNLLFMIFLDIWTDKHTLGVTARPALSPHLKVVVPDHLPSLEGNSGGHVVKGQGGKTIGGQQCCAVLYQFPCTSPQIQDARERSRSFTWEKWCTNYPFYKCSISLSTLLS